MTNNPVFIAKFGKEDYTATMKVRATCPDCGGPVEWNGVPWRPNEHLIEAMFGCVECGVTGAVHIVMEQEERNNGDKTTTR